MSPTPPEPEEESAIARALRLVGAQATQQHDAKHGDDPDRVISESVSSALRATYEPFNRSFNLFLNDLEVFSAAQGMPHQTQTLSAQIRSSMKLIGSTLVSWNIQGFGGKQTIIDGARDKIAQNLLSAYQAFPDQPNLIPPLDQAQATGIANSIVDKIRTKVLGMQEAAQRAGSIA